jgi:hypothetical protein
VEDYRDLGISGRGKNVTEGKMGLILDGIKSGKIPTGSWLAVEGGRSHRTDFPHRNHGIAEPQNWKA